MSSATVPIGALRSGDALQLASRVDTVVLDKTGTITWGKPRERPTS